MKLTDIYNMQHTLKPYLINAFYSWAMDIGYSPLIQIEKWRNNIIPQHLDPENDLIFNIHPKAVRNLVFGKDKIEFEALFQGNPSQISIDYQSISRIYNSEDSFGLDFECPVEEEQPSTLNKKSHLQLVK